jgi:TRAP-type mannitol/chloroaromatic compound transport system permease small subunit
MKYNNNIHQAKHIGLQNNVHHTNKLGLAKAYQSNKSTHIDGDTMYIAGTKSAKDWYDNFTKLLFGSTKHADRYKDAENT